MDEPKNSTDPILRVFTIVTGPALRNPLWWAHQLRPEQQGCSDRPWRTHPKGKGSVPCERCGIEFDGACYEDRVATDEELARHSPHDEDCATLIFLCAGCRS